MLLHCLVFFLWGPIVIVEGGLEVMPNKVSYDFLDWYFNCGGQKQPPGGSDWKNNNTCTRKWDHRTFVVRSIVPYCSDCGTELVPNMYNSTPLDDSYMREYAKQCSIHWARKYLHPWSESVVFSFVRWKSPSLRAATNSSFFMGPEEKVSKYE